MHCLNVLRHIRLILNLSFSVSWLISNTQCKLSTFFNTIILKDSHLIYVTQTAESSIAQSLNLDSFQLFLDDLERRNK